MAKIQHLTCGTGPAAEPMENGKIICLNYGFIIQCSKDTGQHTRLMGHEDRMAYLITFDAKYKYLWGITTPRKVPPINWLNALLTQIKPTTTTKLAVRMDQGGELGCNKQVQMLFLWHGYIIQPTTADSLSQNSMAECQHQMIGKALQAMLHGVDLPMAYLPEVFYHYL